MHVARLELDQLDSIQLSCSFSLVVMSPRVIWVP